MLSVSAYFESYMAGENANHGRAHLSLEPLITSLMKYPFGKLNDSVYD